MGHGRVGRKASTAGLREPGRRGTRAGAGISFAAHGLFGLLVWTGVGGGHPLQEIVAGTGDMGTLDEVPVNVDVVAETVPEAPPATTVAAPDAQARPRRLVAAARAKLSPAAPIATAVTAPAGESAAALTAPPIDPIEDSGEGLAEAPAVASTPGAPGAAHEPSGASELAAGPSQPAAHAKNYVEPEVASYLRSQDYFPALPSSLRERGAHYLARLDICVSTEGRVVDVDFRRPAAPALDSLLVSAIKNWRYRPLMVNGAPAPFCHHMTVTYEM